MTGISGSGAPQSTPRAFEASGNDPQARIRFENTLAAHAAAGKQPEEAVKSILDMHSMSDVPSPLAGRPQLGTRRIIPTHKVLQSLNHLVQKNHVETGTGFDVHR